MISAELPHYLLFSEAHTRLVREVEVGSWRFQLQALDAHGDFSAAGTERQVTRDRLEVLAVLRGLEALDQPSRVTLLCGSRYVQRGMRHGLPQWERNNWQWERFGRRVQVKNHDLWRRVSVALKFHKIDCRLWRVDPGSSLVEESVEASPSVPRPHFLGRRRAEASELEAEREMAAG